MGHPARLGRPGVMEKSRLMTLIHDLLLVEDDLLLARALQRALQARGIQARHVARCATASALQGPFRVGVFDLDLPDGDGVELAQRLTRAGIVQRAIFYTACSHPARLACASAIGSVFAKSRQLGSLMDMLTPARAGRETCVSAPLH
jgi:ActR/RegA family two-component response regulator